MTTCYLSPIGNHSQISTSGAPLSGGQIFTYQAGTTTLTPTYMDNAGSVGQANPITLNTYGLPANPIWIPGGQAVKFVIKDALGNTIRTIDNVYGNNDPAAPAQQVAQNVMASRALGTTYTNTTGRPIFVHVRVASNSATATSVTLAVAGVNLTSTTVTTSNSGSQVAAMVPAGASYTATLSGSGSLFEWVEVR